MHFNYYSLYIYIISFFVICNPTYFYMEPEGEADIFCIVFLFGSHRFKLTFCGDNTIIFDESTYTSNITNPIKYLFLI